MTFDDEQILQNYIARLLAMQDERDEWLGEDDLKTVARDLGLSDEDLERLDVLTEGHRQRAKNFGQRGAWGEAISEFRQAATLNPFDGPLLYELAVAHASRWEETGDPKDRQAAERYARRCIELDPDHQPSYELLTALKRPAKEAAAPPKRAAVLAVVVALALFGAGVAFFAAQRSLPPTETPPIAATPPAPNPPPAPNSAPAPPAAPAAAEAQIPIRFLDDGQALRLDVQRSLFNRYPDAYSYRLHATLHNKTDELHRLRLKLTLHDADGAVLLTKFLDGRSQHQPYLRPGDTAPLATLIHEKKLPPDLQEARLAIDLVEREPAAAAYDAPVPTPLTWEFPQPAHLDLTVYERESRVSEGSREPMHFLTLAVRNNSARTVQHLRLKVTWFDAQDAVLTSELTYVVASSGPAMRAGETWVARAIGKLPTGNTPPYTRYTVSVAEAE